MRKLKDLSGKKFGRLLVIEKIGYKNYKGIYKCLCDCGNYSNVLYQNLTSGGTKSCGCLAKEMDNAKMMQFKNITHGLSKTRLYRIWNCMTQRCINPKSTGYKDYGGRGIKVCEEWLIFENFKKDMIDGYDSNLSIDRIKVNGDYEKSNCRWATQAEQMLNTTRNRYITYKNETKTVTEWARYLGITKELIMSRLRRGWDASDALSFTTNHGKYKIRKLICEH
jgi:hypothetical protein